MISPQISKLLESLKQQANSSSETLRDGSYVKVNDLAKKAGVFYEKIRYLIDYKEDHTIRRNAIQRILKRNLFFKTGGEKIALLLIQELVRGGYLESDSFLENRISNVQNIIDRFLSLENLSGHANGGDPSINKVIISLAASEIEIYLFGDKNEDLVLFSFYETVKDQVKISTGSSSEIDTQIYIACLRSLLKADDQTIAYRLWLKFLPQWMNLKDASEFQNIAKSLTVILYRIKSGIKDDLSWKIARKLKNYSIYFNVIKEITARYGADSERVLNNKSFFEKEAKNILDGRYKKENARIQKSALRAILYILFTKTILAFALELPYDVAILGKVYYPALVVNVIFHPFLLFLITYTIKPLGAKNTDLIISGLNSVICGEDSSIINIKNKKSKNFLYFIFLLLYGFIFLISFGVVIFILNQLHFNIMSIALFTFFLTLVTYFGLRIRFTSKNWAVTSTKERTFYLLGNILIMPIVEVGRWLSHKFDSVNILVFVMDFIIETPFKVLLSVFDSFLSFLKDKKEEMY